MHSTDDQRRVVRVERGMPASDGAGVALTRVIGTPRLRNLDPFLMLDAFGSDTAGDYIAGFPDHPHRGFETVTYMLAGRMRHRDNKGNQGDLGPGSVQWMTAGRGIVHSEMPMQESGRMAGFQLWVNLPARDKMCEPRYQDIAATSVKQHGQINACWAAIIKQMIHNRSDGAARIKHIIDKQDARTLDIKGHISQPGRFF